MTWLNPSVGRDAEAELSPEQFRKIAAILRDKAGITLADGAQKLVISRLSRHLRRLNFDNYDPYLAMVAGKDGSTELVQMINALTTNTTRFFREPEHFDIMAEQLMPRLAQKARAGGRVRLWSAACSSGEEPYSIAATLLAALPDAARYDVKILATDINDIVLGKAEAGLYDANVVQSLSPERLGLMFEPGKEGGRLRIRKSLRDLISFRYMNFMDPWPVSGPFDAIFCRNVVIYMDPPTQMQIWTGLERVLDEEGLLFIGHSERIGPSLSHRLQLFGPTAFRRPGAGPDARPPAKESRNASA